MPKLKTKVSLKRVDAKQNYSLGKIFNLIDTHLRIIEL